MFSALFKSRNNKKVEIMKAKYYSKPEHVLFYNPITRLLARIFGAKHFVIKCRVCGKIPTEIYGDTCLDHKTK